MCWKDLPGGDFDSTAIAVSPDGNTILCAGTSALGEEYAVWTPATGMRSIRDRLLSLGVSAVGPWLLNGHHGGLSANTTVFAGYGTNPGGAREAWIAHLPPTCYADCNSDGALNLADFGCFQTKFALGEAYADCNGDGARNLSDFGCFQTRFALGCP